MLIISRQFEELNLKMSALDNVKVITPEWIEIVAKQVASLKFGVVQITIHESRVVQIEKTEKVRLDGDKRNTAH